jgi:hypothetical protein
MFLSGYPNRRCIDVCVLTVSLLQSKTLASEEPGFSAKRFDCG